MKILLLLCRQAMLASYQLPVGVGYISACLKQAGHEVRLVNPNHSRLELADLITAEIRSFAPEIVGVGGMAFHFNEIAAVAKLVRKILPEAILLAGGALVTAQPRTILQGIPELDFGVVGEGEYTTVELVNSLQEGGDLSRIAGIVYRSADNPLNIHENPPRPVPDDLDALPPCDYEGLGIEVYASLHRPGECAPALINSYASRVLPIMTSRGCPYACTFCCHQAAGRCYRSRSLDSVFAEIEDAVAKWGINCLFIYDDLFCLGQDRLEAFCRRIAPMGLRWQCSLTARQVRPELLDLMRESGCCCIGLGVESMSPPVLASMGKHATRALLDEVLPVVYEARIGLWSNLIFGDPAENLETVTETLEWYGNHPEYNLRAAWIGYHPGSRIYDEALAKGLIGDPIEYLSTRSSEINGTAMTDEEFLTARLLVDRALLSFGHAGKLLELYTDEAGNSAARCRCPHCGAEGTCHTLDGRHNLIASPSCPECNRSYRLPIFMRYQAPPELRPLLQDLQAMLKERPSLQAVEQKAEAIIAIDPCNTYARKLLIMCADQAGDPIQAARLLEQLICFDAYNPELFESMARRLCELDLANRSHKYAKKAKHLRAMGITHTAILEISMPAEDRAALIQQQLGIVRHTWPIASFLIGGHTAIQEIEPVSPDSVSAG